MLSLLHTRTHFSSLIEESLRGVGYYGCMLRDVVKDCMSKGIPLNETSRQIIKIGRDSLPIILLTAIFCGMVMAIQTAYGLQRFGAKNYIGNVVGLGLVRELGPVLSAIMLCGRVSAGIAAEIGSMVVTEQVDAIRALGANPIRKLVTPKIIAGTISMPLLVIFADVVGILGGQLVAVYELGQTAHRYQSGIYYTLFIRDVIDGLIKASVFGFLLVSIACAYGLKTTGGTEGVGRTTTAAAVTSAIVIFTSNFFITKLLILLS
jgi:phospholipid/cholesterol/gamma-HCH transport system permease protein